MGIAEFLGNLGILIKAVRLKPPAAHEAGSIGALVEANARRIPLAVALIDGDRQLTWAEFNQQANQVADQLRRSGISAGDCVSLFMQNRLEFLVCLVGILKLGAVAGLINTQLIHRQLQHCIELIETRFCIFGEELTAPLEEVRHALGLPAGAGYLFVRDSGARACPDWALSYEAMQPELSTENPPECARVTYGDRACYIFTSGTTGLPKAAIITHKRSITQAKTSAILLQRQQQGDRMYNCLPLYHATGLNMGWLSTVCTGASTVIRRKLSVSHFWEDIRRHQCTCFVYIGEFLRYLLAREPQSEDRHHRVRMIVGNGLRPDIWLPFKQRFAIPRIGEFYGASEGNSGFGNVLNKDCTVGMGVSPLLLAAWDPDLEQVVRDAAGRCRPVARGEPGLLLLKVTPAARFEGYTSEQATRSKLLENVLTPGDLYFNTGDLMREVEVGFSFGFKHYQFVDRLGDTFRWKSENVSTTEVGEILNQHPDIELANVYGVVLPGADGRAGMAALLLREGLGSAADLDLTALSEFIITNLPGFARPLFLRILQELPTTATMKLQKHLLKEQAFHPDRTGDEILFLPPGSNRYRPLDATSYRQIMDLKLTF